MGEKGRENMVRVNFHGVCGKVYPLDIASDSWEKIEAMLKEDTWESLYINGATDGLSLKHVVYYEVMEEGK